MPSSSELSYEEEFSDPDSGVYTYRYHGRVTTLTFDEQGYLMRWVETAGPEYSDMTVTYEYKTITVDSATYKPSVYAIPTGYEEQWKPQYTEEERLRILGGQ